jgi:tRNA threonylcarbamoyladenosine biosynthesis protein TsaB
MILLLDTSTPLCRLTIIDGDERFDYEWQADRELAKKLLGWLNERLQERSKTFTDITGIGAYLGPGSFTGLRIGLTVLNTLADSLGVPIVGGAGENWQGDVLDKLKNGQNDQILLPYYDRDANITTARK